MEAVINLYGHRDVFVRKFRMIDLITPSAAATTASAAATAPAAISVSEKGAQLFRKEQNILKKQEEERQRQRQQYQLQEVSRANMNDLPPDQPAYMRHMKDSFGARQADPSNATPQYLVAGDENSIQTSRRQPERIIVYASFRRAAAST